MIWFVYSPIPITENSAVLVLSLMPAASEQHVTMNSPMYFAIDTDQYSSPFCRKAPPKHVFPPTCYTVDIMFPECKSEFFFHQTRRAVYKPKGFILRIIFLIVQMVFCKIQVCAGVTYAPYQLKIVPLTLVTSGG